MYIASIHVQQRRKCIAFILQNGTLVNQYHWGGHYHSGGRPVLRAGNLSDFFGEIFGPEYLSCVEMLKCCFRDFW
jgi:hypothetical protein